MTTLRLMLASLFVVVTTKVALAAEGGGGFTFAVEGFYIIDFIIMAWLLWAVTKGPIRKFFLKRHQEVANELEAATRLREEAEARLAELNEMFAGFDAEVQQIRAQFKADGEREKERILAQAEGDAQKIRDGAKKTLEQEMAKLRERLEAELVGSVLKGAEAKVRQRLDQATQQRLAAGYVDDLEKLDNLEQAA